MPWHLLQISCTACLLAHEKCQNIVKNIKYVKNNTHKTAKKQHCNKLVL